MDEAALWSPHLQPDERVLWQVPVVEARYLAEQSRQRKLGVIVMAASIVAAGMFAVSLMEMMASTNGSAALTASLNRVLLLPIYCLAILACLVIAGGQISRFNLRHPAAAAYAVTSARVLAIDGNGALIDQIEGSEIAALDLSGPDNASNLTVRRKAGAGARLSIAYVDHAAEAKSAMEEAFGKPAA
ncbi:MAG: hypothetical protein ABI740_09325 [Alphaproteobacteria bacterium]